MKALKSLNLLQDLCASQRGMFTTAQAAQLGVGKMDVSRLAKNGHIERMRRGVYRSLAVPSSRGEDIYATWLSLDSSVPAFERPVDGSGFTASLNTAAWLLGLGELRAVPVSFSHPGRRQTRDPGIRFLNRWLDPEDIVVVGGIPVTTPSRTVIDLIDAGEDLSLVAAVIRDADSDGILGDIASEVDSRASRCGYPRDFGLYDYLRGGFR